jgi:hypothetical protein
LVPLILFLLFRKLLNSHWNYIGSAFFSILPCTLTLAITPHINNMARDRIITKAELDEHSLEVSYWVAVNGKVYDMTNFHYGGGKWSMHPPSLDHGHLPPQQPRDMSVVVPQHHPTQNK